MDTNEKETLSNGKLNEIMVILSSNLNNTIQLWSLCKFSTGRKLRKCLPSIILLH